MIYYKAFDPNLCGWGGFQYEIGKEFTVEDPKNPEDTWRWTSFSHSMECCIQNSHNLNIRDAIPRVCEVTPIGRTHRFVEWIGSHYRSYYTAHRIKIGQELSREEIVLLLRAENSYPQFLLDMHPTYDELRHMKSKFRGYSGALSIVKLPYLTAEQKRSLIAKQYHSMVREDEY